MTSRQRVTAAINHREPDRMPIDLGMYTATGISAFAYQHLRAHLGFDTKDIEIHELMMGLARVHDDVLKRFHCDCMLINPPATNARRWKPRDGYEFIVPGYFTPEMSDMGDWVFARDSRRMRMPAGGYFFDGDWINFSDLEGPDRLDRFAKSAERIAKETDYFTVYRGFTPFYNSTLDYFCDMITDPEPLIEANRILLDAQLKSAGQVIDKMGSMIGAVTMSGDLGAQSGPMCRPDAFERVVAPFLAQFCAFIHRNSDLKVFLHCCGSVEPLIPLLIQCGIDILNPVQISAAGMEPEKLKARYGRDLVFWGGGVDTQNILGVKTPTTVAENTRELVSIFKPGGGYIFCPVHNIMGNVPPENIVAAYDAAYRAGFY